MFTITQRKKVIHLIFDMFMFEVFIFKLFILGLLRVMLQVGLCFLAFDHISLFLHH